MAGGVIDLACPVFVFLAAFQRKVSRGLPVLYEDVRQEILALLRDMDERAISEPGLSELWGRAKNPLIYLVDEVMIVNTQWEHGHRWDEENLEVTLLGHPKGLGGQLFYDEADDVRKQFETSERLSREDLPAMADLLTVFYMCLKLGFKGKLATVPADLAEYTLHLFAKLPAYSKTRSKELFPDAYEHTVKVEANYEPVMRLLSVAIVFVGIVVTYVVASRLAWWAAVEEIRKVATHLGAGGS